MSCAKATVGSNERAGQLTGGIWLIGLGLLFATGWWWPGIMFVIGVASIAQGLAEGRGWSAFQGGLWCIAIGVWALYHFNLALFFVALGVSMILLTLVRRPGLGKPKPFTDNTLE